MILDAEDIKNLYSHFKYNFEQPVFYFCLLDILEPSNEEDDYEARSRSLSSIHIKITK